MSFTKEKKSLDYTTLKLNCLAKVVEIILAHDNNYMSSVLPGHLDAGIPQVDGPRPTRSPNSGSDDVICHFGKVHLFWQA